MHREGHHGLNALLYAPIALSVAFLGSVELAVLGAVFFVGLSSIPDFDRHFDGNMNSHRSNLWTLVPIKHRGFTHTVWFALLVGVVGGAFGAAMTSLAPAVPAWVVMVFTGVCSGSGVMGHVLGDMMTPMGVQPWSPIRKTRYSLGWFKAKSKVANFGFLIVGVMALVTALGLGVRLVGFDVESYSTAAVIFV